MAKSALITECVAKSAPGAIVQPLQNEIFMQVLLAVVEDLYTFAVSMFFPWRIDSETRQMQLYLPASRVISQFRESAEVDAYRMAEAAIQDRLAGVTVGEGDREYVPTSVLAQKVADVYPSFITGVENSALATNTVRLRSVVHDEFGAGFNQLPLAAHEYVYYKLLRRGVRIAWPDVRPRTPGSWAKILSPVEGVTVDDTPSVGAVMEFALSPENGEEKSHLAYVEKVFPDQSIAISEANWPARGIYNERVLSSDEWRVFHPTFITVR